MCVNTTSNYYPVDGICYEDLNNQFTNLITNFTVTYV